MDKTDIKICLLLLGDSRRTFRDLGEKLNLSVNAVHKRVQSLQERGIIRAFTTKLSISALNIVPILVYGKTEAKVTECVPILAASKQAYWCGVGGNNTLYIGAYLRQIWELDPFLAQLKNNLKMKDLVVGIMSVNQSLTFTSKPGGQSGPTGKGYELSLTDYQIIKAMAHDSRKNALDVAAEIYVSPKTVKRRIDAMDEAGLLEYSAEWHPDGDNDILSVFRLELPQERDKAEMLTCLTTKYHPHIIFTSNFSNLPHFLFAMIWTPTTKITQELVMKIEEEELVSVTLDTINSGFIFETWREELVIERATKR